MKVSLLVPCYNERDGVPQLAAALADLRRALLPVYRLEVVFVDDGSTDGTREVLDRHFASMPDVRIVSHVQNRGLGAALRTGFAHTTGDWVATTDSDCTYNPRQLPEMIRLMELGADVVVASPYHPSGGIHNVPRYRIFLSRTLSRLYDVLIGRRLYTYTSLFRIYRGELVRDLRFEADGFVSMAEILVRTLIQDAKVVEFPIVLTLRRYGESKAAIARLTGQHLRFLARVLAWRLTGRFARGVEPFRRSRAAPLSRRGTGR